MALAALVAGIGCSRGSTDEGGAEPPSSLSGSSSTIAESGDPPIEALFTDTFFYRGSDTTDWHTAVAVTLRNVSNVPVVLDSVEFLDNRGLETGVPEVIGPHAPSLSLNVFPGSPPVDVVDGTPVLQELPGRLQGFAIPPLSEEHLETSSTISTDVVYVADKENDASIILPIRLIEQGGAGSIKGIRVGYRQSDGSVAFIECPDIEFGIVPSADLNAGRASRAERGED